MKSIQAVKMQTSHLVIAIAIVLGISEIYGATWYGSFRSADHPGKCVITNHTILNEGETITVTKSCTRIICSNGGNATFYSCGAKAVEPPCTLGEIKYPDAEYPKCCLNVLHCPGRVSEF